MTYATFYNTEDALPCIAELVKLGLTVTVYRNERGRTNVEFPAYSITTAGLAEAMIQRHVDADKAFWRGPHAEAEEDDRERRLEHEREQGGGE